MSASDTIGNGKSVSPEAMGRLKVWDLPTRVMHWLLVVSIGVCWWTGLHDQLEYHLYSGHAALWIVLMRMAVLARFSSSAVTPLSSSSAT